MYKDKVIIFQNWTPTMNQSILRDLWNISTVHLLLYMSEKLKPKKQNIEGLENKNSPMIVNITKKNIQTFYILNLLDLLGRSLQPSFFLDFERWVAMWFFKLCAWIKPLLQTAHTWGLSSVWVLLCILRLLVRLKLLLHTSHL